MAAKSGLYIASKNMNNRPRTYHGRTAKENDTQRLLQEARENLASRRNVLGENAMLLYFLASPQLVGRPARPFCVASNAPLPRPYANRTHSQGLKATRTETQNDQFGAIRWPIACKADRAVISVTNGSESLPRIGGTDGHMIHNHAGLPSNHNESVNLHGGKFASTWAEARAQHSPIKANRGQTSRTIIEGAVYSSMTDSSPTRLAKLTPTESPLRNGAYQSPTQLRTYTGKSTMPEESPSPLRQQRISHTGESRSPGKSPPKPIPISNTDAKLRNKIHHRHQLPKCGPIPHAHKPFQPVVNNMKQISKLYKANAPKMKTDDDDNSSTLDIADYDRIYSAQSAPSSGRSGSKSDTKSLNSNGSKSAKSDRDEQNAEHVLTAREGEMYRRIQSVYGDDSVKKKRVRRFYQKLEDIQKQTTVDQEEDERQKLIKRHDSKRRQGIQLTKIRSNFNNAQARRFRTQYVTARVLEYEKEIRADYGLPDEYEESVGYKPANMPHQKNRRASTKSKTGDDKKQRKKNMKVYGLLFSSFKVPKKEAKINKPKMEGIDTVVLEKRDSSGKVVRESKRDVQDIVREAQDLLDGPSKEMSHFSSASPRRKDFESSPERSQVPAFVYDDDDDVNEDDSDDDIFEKARKKYGLVSESESEEND